MYFLYINIVINSNNEKNKVVYFLNILGNKEYSL